MEELIFKLLNEGKTISFTPSYMPNDKSATIQISDPNLGISISERIMVNDTFGKHFIAKQTIKELTKQLAQEAKNL